MRFYELFLADDDTVQGRISLRIDGGVANVDIVETAPYNYGHFRGGKGDHSDHPSILKFPTFWNFSILVM